MRVPLKHIKQLETWEWMRQLTHNDEKASPDGTLIEAGRKLHTHIPFKSLYEFRFIQSCNFVGCVFSHLLQPIILDENLNKFLQLTHLIHRNFARFLQATSKEGTLPFPQFLVAPPQNLIELVLPR